MKENGARLGVFTKKVGRLVMKLVGKRVKWLALIIFMIFIVIPVIIYLLSTVPMFPVGGNNDWAGFWGGYIGALVGGIITLYVMQGTIESEKELRRREEKIDFFNNIIHLSAEMSSLTGDLCICMSRDKIENKNDLHERSLVLSNAVSRLFNEIRVLLETRKTIYDVDSLIIILDEIYTIETRYMDLYEDSVRVKFTDRGLEREKDSLKRKLNDLLENYEKTLRNIVSFILLDT